MKLRICIELDNAAFGPDPAPEVERIIAKLLTWQIAKYTPDPTPFWLRDINGNVVGTATITGRKAKCRD